MYGVLCIPTAFVRFLSDSEQSQWPRRARFLGLYGSLLFDYFLTSNGLNCFFAFWKTSFREEFFCSSITNITTVSIYGSRLVWLHVTARFRPDFLARNCRRTTRCGPSHQMRVYADNEALRFGRSRAFAYSQPFACAINCGLRADGTIPLLISAPSPGHARGRHTAVRVLGQWERTR